MRDYATVSPQFWLGKTGRELRKAGAEAQVVAFYLMTSPHANMLGLYYLPVLYLAHETGLGFEGASKGLQSAIKAGFCSYDEHTEMVWVHEMAAYQVGRSLKPGDNRCAGVRNEYGSLPENPFLPAFFDRYQGDFHMTTKRGNTEIHEGASEGLGSQDQEQDQEQDQDQDQDKNLIPGADGNQHQEPEPVFISLPLSDGKSFFDVTENYMSEQAALYPGINIEQEFRNMRGWLNSNPTKRKTPRGIKRFITTWLQNSQDKPRGWQSGRAAPARDVNTVSPPDNTIPDGFRG